MPQIPPITDAYIDEIIKAPDAYNPTLNKTQGVKLRELIKKLRDHFAQGMQEGLHEENFANITERDAYNVESLPFQAFVNDDRDGRWALYRATSTGIAPDYIKISDPDLLNAVMSSIAIKEAYESNENTNAFTDEEKNKISRIDEKANLSGGNEFIGEQIFNINGISFKFSSSSLGITNGAHFASILPGIIGTAGNGMEARIDSDGFRATRQSNSFSGNLAFDHLNFTQGSNKRMRIVPPALTGDYTVTFQNKSGTIALTSDIPDIGNKIDDTVAIVTTYPLMGEPYYSVSFDLATDTWRKSTDNSIIDPTVNLSGKANFNLMVFCRISSAIQAAYSQVTLKLQYLDDNDNIIHNKNYTSNLYSDVIAVQVNGNIRDNLIIYSEQCEFYQGERIDDNSIGNNFMLPTVKKVRVVISSNSGLAAIGNELYTLITTFY